MSESSQSECLKEVDQVEDRLSSLPDSILINILSRLEIKTAAATSVLSPEWRYLWTAVTSCYIRDSIVDFDNCSRQRVDINILNILQQLTSPKLYVFDAQATSMSVSRAPNVVESCFRELCSRNVEQICFNSSGLFCAPAYLFETQSLVILHLSCKVQLPDNAPVILFPNLKKLWLDILVNFPSWLGTLFSSSPLLEDLRLMLILSTDFDDLQQSDLQIVAPNLKSLHLNMVLPLQIILRMKIFIDAPSLTHLNIYDCTSCYYFVHKPFRLINAVIDLAAFDEEDLMADYDEELMDVGEDYLLQMAMFVAGMSSVCKLELCLQQQSQKKIYTFLHSVHHGPLTIFPNLFSLKTTFEDIGLNVLNDLLVSLHCFPNLNSLKVDLESDLSLEHYSWCVPDSIPECLVSKLKRVEISMSLDKIEEELKFLSYVLSNATVLEKFYLAVGFHGKTREAERLNARDFVTSLFGFQRGSATCEIVFLNRYESMRVSSNDFNSETFAIESLKNC